MDKDTKKLLKACIDQGFRVGTRTSGHPYVHTGDGEYVTDIAGSGSDWRGRRNTLARLKGAGLSWPAQRRTS